MSAINDEVQLQDAFFALAAAIEKLDRATIEKLWDELRNYYTETQRYYHTLTHIHDLYCKFVQFREQFRNDSYHIVLWTIFYHDIIYNPMSKTNEEDSATLFEETYASLLPLDTLNTVREYILATKNHTVIAATTSDTTLQQFLDLDLSILGSSRDRYEQYAKEIRLEYQHYADEAYRHGRSAVLRQFLGISSSNENCSEITTETTTHNLFASRFFYDMWESQARDNIAWELEELSKTPLSDKIFGRSS